MTMTCVTMLAMMPRHVLSLDFVPRASLLPTIHIEHTQRLLSSDSQG